MIHKISTSTHSFTEEYRAKLGWQKEEVMVTLEIDHLHKRYSIYPFNASKSNNRFLFNNGGESAKWEATIKAIQAANNYAQQELFGTIGTKEANQ